MSKQSKKEAKPEQPSGNAKPKRSIEAIQQEYGQLSMRAGTVQYEIHCKEKDLDMLNQAMRDLNFEFVAAKAEEAKKAAEQQIKDAEAAASVKEGEKENGC